LKVVKIRDRFHFLKDVSTMNIMSKKNPTYLGTKRRTKSDSTVRLVIFFKAFIHWRNIIFLSFLHDFAEGFSWEHLRPVQ